MDVAILLAPVALCGLTDVLADSYLVGCKSLVGGAAVNAFYPIGFHKGARGQSVLSFDEGEVVRDGGIKVITAGYKFDN